MTHKERLLHYLFNRPGRKPANFRLAPGTKAETKEGLTEEELCEDAHGILFAVDNGLIEPSPTFDGPPKKQIDVMNWESSFVARQRGYL